MSGGNAVKFPNELNDGTYVGSVRLETAMIWTLGIFMIVVTREFFICVIAAFVISKIEQYINDRYQNTALVHVAYFLGVPISNSHLLDHAFDKDYLG